MHRSIRDNAIALDLSTSRLAYLTNIVDTLEMGNKNNERLTFTTLKLWTNIKASLLRRQSGTRRKSWINKSDQQRRRLSLNAVDVEKNDAYGK